MKFKELKKKILKDNPGLEQEIKRDLAFQVGQMLVEARIMKGTTQKKLAELLGTKQPSIAKIENGATLPSFRFLKRIADVWETYLISPRFAFMEERKEQVEYDAIHVITMTLDFGEPNFLLPRTESASVLKSSLVEIYR